MNDKHTLEDTAQLVTRVCEETMETEPRKIAEFYGITIKEEALPGATMGIFTFVGAFAYIVLNEDDNATMQRYVIAVALFYYLKDMPRILLRNGPHDHDFSAAHFAYDLLCCYEKATDAINSIPDEIQKQAKELLN